MIRVKTQMEKADHDSGLTRPRAVKLPAQQPRQFVSSGQILLLQTMSCGSVISFKPTKGLFLNLNVMDISLEIRPEG